MLAVLGLALGVVLVVCGVALLSVPVALIVGGLALSAVCLYVNVEPRRRSSR